MHRLDSEIKAAKDGDEAMQRIAALRAAEKLVKTPEFLLKGNETAEENDDG